jgi:hypothetical protein
MKGLKHIKRFNESEENLNISDVRSSKKSINEDIYDLFIEFEKSIKKHIQEVQDIYHKALLTKDERYINELKSYILMLKKVPANLMKIGNDYVGKVDVD